MAYDVYSEFDIEKHKEKYIHYLEVVILEDGKVVYAVPSHQEKLIKIACDKLNVDRNTLYNMCPQEYMFDVITWLCKLTNCISVWTNFYIKDTINNKQLETLKKLKSSHIYEGTI